jgi:hypothetical protein
MQDLERALRDIATEELDFTDVNIANAAAESSDPSGTFGAKDSALLSVRDEDGEWTQVAEFELWNAELQGPHTLDAMTEAASGILRQYALELAVDEDVTKRTEAWMESIQGKKLSWTQRLENYKIALVEVSGEAVIVQDALKRALFQSLLETVIEDLAGLHQAPWGTIKALIVAMQKEMRAMLFSDQENEAEIALTGLRYAMSIYPCVHVLRELCESLHKEAFEAELKEGLETLSQELEKHFSPVIQIQVSEIDTADLSALFGEGNPDGEEVG